MAGFVLGSFAWSLVLGCGEVPVDKPGDPPVEDTTEPEPTDRTETPTGTAVDTGAPTETVTDFDRGQAAVGTYIGPLKLECSQGYILVVTDTCVRPQVVQVWGFGASSRASADAHLEPACWRGLGNRGLNICKSSHTG